MNKDLPVVDSRLLQSFVAVAELKHFGKAADVVNATQPGVSQHIARLEAILGVHLLERTKRSVELTAAGHVALRHAHVVLSHLRNMREDCLRVASGLGGTVNVGLTASVLYTDIPARIAAFRESNSDVEVVVHVHRGDKLRSLMDSGDIDAAVTTLPLPELTYLAKVATHQAMGVAMRATHRLADRDSVEIADLLDDPFIVVSREQHRRNHDALVARFFQLGAQLKVAAYETSFQSILARVAVGDGVGLVAAGLARDVPAQVRVIQLKDPDLSETPVYASARKDSATELTLRFVNAISESAAPSRQ